MLNLLRTKVALCCFARIARIACTHSCVLYRDMTHCVARMHSCVLYRDTAHSINRMSSCVWCRVISHSIACTHSCGLYRNTAHRGGTRACWAVAYTSDRRFPQRCSTVQELILHIIRVNVLFFVRENKQWAFITNSRLWTVNSRYSYFCFYYSY
jgi:hypothetical protein